MSSGASATVQRNDVSKNIYTPQTVVSTGILLFGPGNVTIEDNKASKNDVNIFAFSSTSPVIIRDNEVSGGTFDGIDLVGTTGANVSDNTSVKNAFDGIFVDDTSSNNSITDNEFEDNGLFDAEDISVGTDSCDTANTWTDNDCETDNHGGCLCDDDADSATRSSATFIPAQRPNSPINGGSHPSRVPSP